jgi:NAD(P)-dependent dehydrogenase (short-subunit alcohol dehydrogenase family)
MRLEPHHVASVYCRIQRRPGSHAKLLIQQSHMLVPRARNQERARDARSSVPNAEATAVGDLSGIAQRRGVAAQVNRLGGFDAVTHNAGVAYREPRGIETEDGLPHVFAVNTLAHYVLTALIEKPRRLV